MSKSFFKFSLGQITLGPITAREPISAVIQHTRIFPCNFHVCMKYFYVVRVITTPHGAMIATDLSCPVKLQRV